MVLHWDGTTWSEAEVTPGLELRDVWGSDAADVWAVGSGAIYHYDGSSWSTVSAFDIAVEP